MLSEYRKLVFRFRDLVLLEEGQDLVEYALVLLLISTAVAASGRAMGVQLVNTYQHFVSVFP